MSSPFETLIQKAVDDRQIPGVMLLASDAKGTFKYEKVFGPKTPTEPMDLNTTFILASCTKIITTIAMMQLVEKGLISLDDDVSSVLPELKNPEILTGFEEGNGKPILVKAKGIITLRQLLTHSSGLCYSMMSPLLIQWEKYHNLPSSKYPPAIETMKLPLIYEPGTSWSYGPSTDWVGFIISRLMKMSLEDYLQEHIFKPLSIDDMTFHQEKNEKVKKNLVKLQQRKSLSGESSVFALPFRNGGQVEWTDETIYETPTKNEFGGSGLIGSATSLLKILVDIASTSPTLLKLSIVDEMFKPQLSASSRAAYTQYAQFSFGGDGDMFASYKRGTEVSWGLGGMMVLQDLESGRRKGTLMWSGLPNLLWTVDRSEGLVCVFASNVVPLGDFEMGRIQREFEAEVYRLYKDSKE